MSRQDLEATPLQGIGTTDRDAHLRCPGSYTHGSQVIPYPAHQQLVKVLHSKVCPSCLVRLYLSTLGQPFAGYPLQQGMDLPDSLSKVRRHELYVGSSFTDHLPTCPDGQDPATRNVST